MVRFRHRPVTKADAIAEHYTKKDGVPVKYVLTTEIKCGNTPYDIFYRDTPHPDYGNRYFGIMYNRTVESWFITDADSLEGEQVDCIELHGLYHYSRYRHDFVQVGPYHIDGGRCYTKVGGMVLPTIYNFTITNGELVNV